MALNESDELLTVFDTEQESEAMVVQSLLESAGIESVIRSLDAPQDVLPGVGGVVVQVTPEQADEARKLIADSREGGPESADAGESAARQSTEAGGDPSI
jgi:Putative prokaryotic signal transducing protein